MSMCAGAIRSGILFQRIARRGTRSGGGGARGRRIMAYHHNGDGRADGDDGGGRKWTNNTEPSFFLKVPTTITSSLTRHHDAASVAVRMYQKETPIQIVSNCYYSVDHNKVGGGGNAGITTFSNHYYQQQHQNTIDEEKENPKTKKKDRTWEETFQLLVSYKEKHGNCNVPQKYKDDPRLGNWVQTQRKRKDTLSDERIFKLNDLGFAWRHEIYEEKWNKVYEKLEEYKINHGNCNVPARYKDDPSLSIWVSDQRRRKDSLSDERIAKLDGLGFAWSNEIHDEQWEGMFEKLVRYAEMNNGDCNIPHNVDDNVNKDLIKWVSQQRLKKSLLSKEQFNKLDNLGLIWEHADKEKANQKWNDKYERLKDYKQNYGNCLVPKAWGKDPSLGRWVSKQRQNYKKGLLSEDRQIKLENMDFTWKVRDGTPPDLDKLDKQWNHQYVNLLAFREEHGHCDVPQYYKKDRSLGNWVHRQRVNQKYGTLRQDRKEQLDEIGFTWNFDDQKDEQWKEKYQELKRFKEQNGHLRLSVGSLKDWVHWQRVQFAAGKVPHERKDLLDKLDFRWEIQTRSI